MSFPDGSVCWIDLGTPEPETTRAFYAGLFGWAITDPDPAGYRLCTLGGRLVAGLGPAEDAGAPYWTVNVSVTDIVATAGLFADLGARIVVPPAEVGTLGSAAVTLDPVGAPLSLWQPGAHLGMEAMGEAGTFAGIGLLTDQAEEAFAFYGKALGWGRGAGEFPLPDGVISPIGPPVERSLWLVRFASDDVDVDAERAVSLGATVVREDPAGGVVLRDPTGALFALTTA